MRAKIPKLLIAILLVMMTVLCFSAPIENLQATSGIADTWASFPANFPILGSQKKHQESSGHKIHAQLNPGTTRSSATSELQVGDLYAVVVGVSKYKDARIPALSVSDKDARSIAEFLKTQKNLFKDIHVSLLVNEDATEEALKDEFIYKLRKAGKDDTVIIFLSGHGVDDPKSPGEFFFLPYDANSEKVALRGIHMNRQWFTDRYDSKRVLIIADACHAGGFAGRGAKRLPPSLDKLMSQFKESEGRVFISSSRADELSNESPEFGHSLFTHFLLEGLGGKAADQDGVVSLKALYEFVYKMTKKASDGYQSPQMEGKLVGNFPVALLRADISPVPQVAQQKPAPKPLEPSTGETTSPPAATPDYKALKLFRQVLDYIGKYYVRETSDAQLINGAIRGMINSTDISNATQRQIEDHFIIPPPYTTETRTKPDLPALKKFRQAMHFIQKQRPFSDRDLVEKAMNGMLQSLEPHSSWLTEDMFKELDVETKGEFGGLGIEITLDGAVLTVVSPIDDTPASKAGIKPGDKILKIKGEQTKNTTLQWAVQQMRGPKGTKVTLTIMREGFKTPKDFTITREVIHVHSVKKEALDAGYGYVKIVSFQETTDTDLKAAITSLGADDKIKGLILDLRNNPGGLMDQAVKVPKLFIDKGLIVYTDSRVKDQRMEFRASPAGTHYKFKMAVLINEGSASASEIVAGALKDHGRALIFGTKSFGKASVQTIIPLYDGSAMRLTTAYYYTPKGIEIQKNGILPDVDLKTEIRKQEERETDIGKRTSTEDDIVMKKALDWLKSKEL